MSAPQLHRRGPWSANEDQMLLQLIERYGRNPNWVRIAEDMQTRTAKQCRERYHQNLKPSLVHSPITAEEGERINLLVKEIGPRWAEIARHMNGRSDNAVKNWWNGQKNRTRRAVLRQQRTDPVHDETAVGSVSRASNTHSPVSPVSPMQRRAYHHHQQQQQQQQQQNGGYYSAPRYATHYVSVPQRPLPTPPTPSRPQQTAATAAAPALVCPYPSPEHESSVNMQYAYRPRPLSTSTSSSSSASSTTTSYEYANYSRRMSVFSNTNSAELDAAAVPSLMPDTGSPTLRGHSSHACPSPTLALPPLAELNGAANNDEKLPSIYHATGLDSPFPSPTSSTFGNEDYTHRQGHFFSRESSVVHTIPVRPITPRAESAALAMMSLPKADGPKDSIHQKMNLTNLLQ